MRWPGRVCCLHWRGQRILPHWRAQDVYSLLMKNRRVFATFGLCLALGACSGAPAVAVPPSAMMIQSTAFENGGMIPQKYTCKGEGMSPPLNFSHVPGSARELVLIMSDPDAPGGDFVHWVVYGIDPVSIVVREGEVPSGGRLGIASTGRRLGYVPPCPPSGTHRYIFHLYALDTFLPSEALPTKADLLSAMQGHIVAEAELMGRFGKL